MTKEEALKSIEIIQEWRQEARYEEYCEKAKQKFLKACGKTTQLVNNLNMVWKYDSKKGMTVTTNLGISMSENQNGATDFGFSEFYFNGKPLHTVGVCSDIDDFLKRLKEIIESNT